MVEVDEVVEAVPDLGASVPVGVNVDEVDGTTVG